MNVTPQSSGSAARRRAVRRAVLPAILFTTLCVPAQETGTKPFEASREALARRAQALDLISKEKREWRLAREALQARIDVVQREISAARERIATSEASIAAAEQKVATLNEEAAAREATAALLAARIDALEQHTLRLLPRLPPWLADNLRAFSQRLPETPEKAAEAKLALGERYQNVIAVLNGIAKWNREVTLTTESRVLDDGTEIQGSAIYFGLGQGYFVGGETRDGKPTIGNVGTATAEGWVWKRADHLAEAIAQTISIYKNERLATLVRLPVQIL